MKTIKCHEDNTPLEHMNATRGLLWIINRVREGELDLDDPKVVQAAAKAHGLTTEDIANAHQFFEESNDLFELVEVSHGN